MSDSLPDPESCGPKSRVEGCLSEVLELDREVKNPKEYGESFVTVVDEREIDSWSPFEFNRTPVFS